MDEVVKIHEWGIILHNLIVGLIYNGVLEEQEGSENEELSTELGKHNHKNWDSELTRM